MPTFKVIAAFHDSPKPTNQPYTKIFGPFSDKRTAEATIVQLSGQAACQSAEAREVPD